MSDFTSSPKDLPDSGIKPGSPTLQADSLPAELLGKPKNSGLGSLSLLQGIFPTQGSNPGLPHCRQILYQLSSKGALTKILMLVFNECLDSLPFEPLGKPLFRHLHTIL